MPSLNPTHIDDERWQHGFAFVDETKQVRIHYIDCPAGTKSEKGTVLLIHGYPNTSYQWRHVITPISNAGYRVIAPDYRGAGDSSHPRSGYDKVTVADDLYRVVHNHLGMYRKKISQRFTNIRSRHHVQDPRRRPRYWRHDCPRICRKPPRAHPLRHVG